MIGAERSNTARKIRTTNWSQRTIARIRNLDHKERILAIILVGIIVYGTFIAIDVFGVRAWLTGSFGQSYDLSYYQERTKLILNGGIIYRDLDIESPPLINYLLVPAQIMGGDGWAYEVYFTVFPILTAIALYMVMQRWDGHYAFLAALIFLVSPFTVVDATWGIQDEAIVVFLYLLPVLLAMVGYKRWPTAGVAVGFWTKFLPVLLYPVLLINERGRSDRLRSLALVAALSALIALPFLLVCPIEFLNFPSYYLLGRSGEGSAGMSVVSLLSYGIAYIPGWVGASITILTLIVSYYLVYKWGLDLWRGAMLTTVMFIAVYPMMHMPLYGLAFPFFTVWAVRDLRVLVKIFVMYILFLFAQGFQMNLVPGLQTSYSWLIALVFVIAGTVLMLQLLLHCLRSRCFLDNDMERREGPSSV